MPEPIKQADLINILDSFVEEVKANPNDFNTKRKIIKELKQSRFKEPWHSAWWKNKKKQEIELLKCKRLQDEKKLLAATRRARRTWGMRGHFGGGYYCSTCQEHHSRRPVLQHKWHPTPIRQQMGDIDIPLKTLRDYFIENVQSLIEEWRDFENTIATDMPICDGQACCGTSFATKKKPNWKNSRTYCKACKKRVLMEKLPRRNCWKHPTTDEYVADVSAREIFKNIYERWLAKHIPLIVEPHAADDVLIKFLNEKKRYLSLSPNDYKYACKACTHKEDIGFIKGTRYASDKEISNTIREMFNYLFAHIRKNNWDTNSLLEVKGVNWNSSAKKERGFSRSRVVLRKK